MSWLAGRPYRLFVVLLTVSALVGFAAGANAQDQPASGSSSEADVFDPDLPDGATVLTGTEAMEYDARWIADAEGRDVDQVRDRLLFQEEVIALIETLPEDVLNSSFASAKFDFATMPKVVLFFKGTVPQDVRAHFDKAGLAGVELRGDMQFSLEEFKERNRKVHAAVVALGFAEVVSGIDIESQQITVDVVLSADLPTLQGKALVDAITSALNAVPVGDRIELGDSALVVREHPLGSTLTTLQHGYGGAGFRDDGVRECTSAFVVRRSSDWVEGVLTASHCEGLNQLEQNNSSGGVDLTFSAPWKGETLPSGTYGDAEWHTTTHDDFPQFWATTSTRRTVTGRISNAGISENADVCHYGRNSGYSCGKVNVVSSIATFTWNGQTVTAQDMTDVDGNIVCQGGDSGGPYFFNYTAWGIHHGLRPSTGDCVFSKIQNAENAFGVFVQTG